jgi:hypothetical protein
MTFKQLLLTTIVIFGTMLSTIAQTINYGGPCNIPVLSLPFNGSTNDVSGNNNNGILGGSNMPFYTTDRFGNNNSAMAYLNSNALGKKDKEESLRTFKSILKYLTFEAPWYFQEISGLDNLWEKSTDISGGTKETEITSQ